MKLKYYTFLFLMIAFSASAIVFPERDDKGRPIQRKAGVESDSSTRVRFVGTHDFNIAANTTAQADWTVPQLQYNSVNADTSMAGVQFKVVGGCDGDKVKFQVVHPTLGVMDEFATDYYVFADETSRIQEHRAVLPAGLYIRVIYTSTCGVAARFIMNLLRYVETE